MTGYFIRIIKTRRRRARELLSGIRRVGSRILLERHSLLASLHAAADRTGGAFAQPALGFAGSHHGSREEEQENDKPVKRVPLDSDRSERASFPSHVSRGQFAAKT